MNGEDFIFRRVTSAENHGSGGGGGGGASGGWRVARGELGEGIGCRRPEASGSVLRCFGKPVGR